MERPQKIAVIGAEGYARQSDKLRVDCFPWSKIGKIVNLRDYDTVILDLLSLKGEESVDWTAFSRVLNPRSMLDILTPDRGCIIIIGDPRFPIEREHAASKTKAHQPFLRWTGMDFHWDNQPGDTLEFDEYALELIEYREYIKHLKRWRYSLKKCNLNLSVIQDACNLQRLENQGFKLKIIRNFFCRTRYHCALAFTVGILFDSQTSTPSQMAGPIIFLPEIDINEDETVLLVLRDLCGVESELPEPSWITELKAPGQEPIDTEIADIESKIKSLSDDLQTARVGREEVRACLRLLYEGGKTLEEAVREVLRGLGAEVEEPPEDSNKEDGWIKVEAEGTTFEGVLEVKSTRNDQFGEDGLRQILDWISRGTMDLKKNYKGIFIGSSAVHRPVAERPYAFSDSWKESAEAGHIVSMKTEDLYLIHFLKESGKLTKENLEQFWSCLFNTDGVFDAETYRDMLEPNDNVALPEPSPPQ